MLLTDRRRSISSHCHGDCITNIGLSDEALGSTCFVLQVQLTLLTAIVKLFLKKPSETQELVQQVLSLATQVTPKYVYFIHRWVTLQLQKTS